MTTADALFAAPTPGLDIDVPATLRRFIQLASESESCRPLVDTAWRELGLPLAIVDWRGVTIASAPTGGAGDAAVVLATGVAKGLTGAAVPGWTLRALCAEQRTLGWLAIGDGDAAASDAGQAVDALCALLSGQLSRSALRQRALAERQTALRQRLVTDPGIRSETVLAETRDVGLHLADHYWPSLLAGGRGALSAEMVSRIAFEWEEKSPRGSFAVPWDGAIVLLYADTEQGPAHRSEVAAAMEHVLRLAAALRPPLDPHVILGELSVPLERLHAHVGLLRRLRRYDLRTDADNRVMQVRDFALARLLDHVSQPSARAFVDQCVGRLTEHDKRHGSSLAHTLELALQHARRDDAARAAFMHRNTFRRRLQQALELVDADLDDPDQRLALHVALKLQRQLPDGLALCEKAYEHRRRP